MRPPAIDERLHSLPARSWRKVHLDFHNTEHVPAIGEGFDEEAFADRLVKSNVDSIVVFAKDMHGYFYYPTAYGPVHPGLTFDLMGRQIAACRARGISVYAYYCVTWDNHLAEGHPEWLVWKRDRTTYLPRFDETPRWTALCLANQDFVDLVLSHSRELLDRYELDGIWYDMPLPIDAECFCHRCLARLRSEAADPLDRRAQHRDKQRLLVDFMRQAHVQAQSIRPGCIVDQNNQTRLGLGERAQYLDNIDIEALPTAKWGYLYFPTNVRYARTFGTSVCGLTGRFERSWADFGGLKHPNQLLSELPAIVANGAQCSIGDQMPPSGRLDDAVYDTIGHAYARIAELEPFLDGAAPVTEAAILVSGDPLVDIGEPSDDRKAEAVCGLTKLLMELHLQFDIVEPSANVERYRLLVLSDDLQVTEEIADMLRGFVAGGGAVIAIHDAIRMQGGTGTWIDGMDIDYKGESPFAPAYLKLGPELLGAVPDYEYALYDGTAQWTSSEPAFKLAEIGEPLFQRTAAHYTSHEHAPFDHLTGYAAVVANGRVAATAFPLGVSYYRHGYWIYRELFRQLLERVLPERLVVTSAPMTSEVTLTNQRAQGDLPERWLVHVVNFSPGRRTPAHCEYLEDPVPLRDVVVALNVNQTLSGAFEAPSGTRLPMTRFDQGWQVTIPEIRHGAVVVFEVDAAREFVSTSNPA